MSDDDDLLSPPSLRQRLGLKLRAALSVRAGALVVGTLSVLIGLYYLLGAVWLDRIDDDLALAPAAVPAGASRAVAMAAVLVGRETDIHFWVANDPFFLPGSLLDNMPNFQQGILAALSRFAVEMTDQIGRTRGSSEADPDLGQAAGLLKYSGTVWLFDTSVSWLPTVSSEKQYRAARRALLSYNERLAAGKATFERRADNLLAALDRIAADLGSASAVIERHLAEDAGSFLDWRADDVFYNTKGRLYAYYLLLRELGRDFAPVLAEREMQAAWAQTIEGLGRAAVLRPWVVVNGAPDSQFLPSHLAAQGFYLLRARTQLREITNILQK
jgi:hypothetical protein